MYRHILKIGNAKYTFNQAALCAFVAEAKLRAVEAPPALPAPPHFSAAGETADGALHHIFEEVGEITALYRAYRASGSMETLMQLKSRLETVSVLYQSHALAEEVLSINSCLPYERRIPLAS